MIPGLGMFTFSQKKIDVGSNKFIIIQRPVFVLSEKFVQTHSLRYPKQHTSGMIISIDYYDNNNAISHNDFGLAKGLCRYESIYPLHRLSKRDPLCNTVHVSVKQIVYTRHCTFLNKKYV